eukprot:698387-Alexandrium_andersonii.AAC.1
MGDGADAAEGGAVKQLVAKLEGAGEKRPASGGTSQKRAASGPPSKAPKAAHWTDTLSKVLVPADGSCLWHALAGALGARKTFSGDPHRLRALVVRHMREHREWYQPSWGGKSPDAEEQSMEDFDEHLQLPSIAG